MDAFYCTLTETAEQLGLSEDQVERLTAIGILTNCDGDAEGRSKFLQGEILCLLSMQKRINRL